MPISNQTMQPGMSSSVVAGDSAENLKDSSQTFIYRTAEKHYNSIDEGLRHNQSNGSFRVENRRARPKIVKNVNNICNIFIF